MVGSAMKGRRRSGTAVAILAIRSRAARGQHGIPALGDPLRAKHRGLDLVRRQHQRRHVEVAVEDIAQARLAADRHPLPDQVGDVAVNRPLRHLKLFGHHAGGDRPGRAPQDLNDLKQTVGSAHGGSPC